MQPGKTEVTTDLRTLSGVVKGLGILLEMTCCLGESRTHVEFMNVTGEVRVKAWTLAAPKS